MTLIQPFKGLRPTREKAQDVSAPPYDVVSKKEAKELAQDKPYSFLHVSRPEIDLPDEIDPYSDEVYGQGKKKLEEMIAEGLLVRDQSPAYYLYQIQDGAHIQTGLVAVASAEKYDQNLIVKHELTRAVKEKDRICMIDTMNAQASPVLLACPPSEEFRKLGSEITKASPDLAVKDERGVDHRLWVVAQAAQIDQLNRIFNQGFEKIYIADGHHRSAAGSRVAALRKEANPNHSGSEGYNYFLSVIFPADEMKILDYNRAVTDLNGLSADELLKALEGSFLVTPQDGAYKPPRPAEMGMFLEGKWYRLEVKKEKIPQDPTQSLDVTLLYDQCLKPILGIGNPRTDKRIDFIGGIRGLAELEKRVRAGEFAVAFAMHPTKMEQIMAVADAGEIMPPKSTWFEPKLVDGLITHLL